MTYPQLISIRSKKLGVLIRDARETRGKSKRECAEALGISSARFSAFERGTKAPSLPELEVLAYFLNVPLEHFWGSEAMSEKPPPTDELDLDSQLVTRQNRIGETIRQARTEAELSLKELAQNAEIPVSRLRAYEKGRRPAPVPELEVLVNAMGLSMQQLIDSDTPVSDWISQKEAVKHFLTLPPELQAFVGKPVNRPYLHIAQRLSEMSVEKLRAVAEGLLEITL